VTIEHESSQDPESQPVSNPHSTPPYSGVTPLVPRPVVTVIALLVSITLVAHIAYDAIDKTYDGWRVTGALGLLVFFVLGGDVSKWLRRGG
jgi:hypothetical protein